MSINLLRRFLPWIIWAISAACFFVQYIARVSPNCMLVDLQQSFNASYAAISSFSSLFLLSYVAMQIPVGIVLDKIGARKSLSISTMICAICTFIFANTDMLKIAQISRFVLGFGASFAFISALQLAKNWFDSKILSILIGTTQAIGMVGGAAGSIIMGQMTANLGWQHSLKIIALLLAALSTLAAIVVRNSPQPNQSLNSTTTNNVSVLHSLKKVLQHKQIWLISVIAGLLLMPSVVLMETWGATYLHLKYNITMLEASLAIGLNFIGWGIGGPIAGLFSDVIGRKKVMIIAGSLSFLIMPCFLYIPGLSVNSIYTLLFFFGLTNTGVIACYNSASDLAEASNSGVTLGFTNGMSVIVGAICVQFIGVALDMMLKKSGALNISHNELGGALSTLMILSALAIVLSFFVKETKK